MKPPAAIVAWMLLCLMSQVRGEAVPVSQQYAHAYETEMGGGDPTDAVGLYRQILTGTEPTNSALAGKALFRIGMCARKAGKINEARGAWKQLMDTFPADHPLTMRAREELKALERDLDRVTIKGRVVDEKGQPVPGVYVLAGDWGNVPPALTGDDGRFQVERRVAGRLATGARYCLVFAEHPVLPLVAADIMVEEGGKRAEGEHGAASQEASDSVPSVRLQAVDPAPVEIVLRPPLALSGYVVDPNGRAIRGATVRFTGFGGPEQDIPLPFGFLLPDSVSDSNGQFRVDGLAMGLRYVTAAEKEGYQLNRAADVTVLTKQSLDPVPSGGERHDQRGTVVPASGVVSLREIVLKREGQAFIDERGILRAEVNLNDAADRSRLEEVVRRFDKGLPSQSELPGGGAREGAIGLSSPARFPFDLYPFSLRWLRGDSVSDAPLRRDDLRGHVVVYHCSSAYLDASLRSQFPEESGVISQLSRAYGRRGVQFVWIVPASDHSDDALRLALETHADIPVAVDRDGGMWEALGLTGYGGNVVVNSEGSMCRVCTDQQLFHVLKAVLAGESRK